MPSPNYVGAADHPYNQTDALVRYSTAQDAARFLLEAPQRYTCLAGGTRSGKTFLIVRAIVARAIHHPESRHAILRFHANAARASIAQDTLPTVLARCFKGIAAKYHRQDSVYTFPNGSRITIGGLDDDERVEKILGLEYASVFLNEASQIPYESAMIAWTRLAQTVPDLMQRGYVDLNPTSNTHWTNRLFGERRDPVSLQPLARPDDYARAFLNPQDNAANLAPAFLESLANLPERQRKRFYEGLYVEALDEALWTYEIIDRNRCEMEMIAGDQRKNLVVAIDPAGVHKKANDASGIIVAAIDHIGDAYVLADRSCHGAPEHWAARAIAAFHEFKADCIVVEINYGGDMVTSTLRGVDANVPIRTVTATRGKAIRAEPISVRYALNKVHHVGRFAKLEDELCAFSTSGYSGQGSPDHADAAIWALTYLFDLEGHSSLTTFYKKEVDS